MTPTVSVIVTTFNIEPYVNQCISSILNQTFQDFELIIVDDASTDGTLATIERSLRFNRDLVRQILPLPTNTPGGVGTPANIGVTAATGKYIFYVDGDDWCEPNMLEQLVEEAERTQADLVIATFRNFDQRSGRSEVPKDEVRLLNLASSDLVLDTRTRAEVLRLNAVPWRKLYRSDFLAGNSIKFPEGNFFFEDNPYHWYNVIKAERIAFVPTVVCHHRINRPGQTVGVVGLELLWFYDHFDTLAVWLAEQGLFEEYSIYLLGWIIGQTEWVASKIDPQHWIALYNRLIQIFERFSQEEIVRALAWKGSGALAWGIVRTVLDRDLFSFAETVRLRDDASATVGRRLVNETTEIKNQLKALMTRMNQTDDIASKAALLAVSARLTK